MAVRLVAKIDYSQVTRNIEKAMIDRNLHSYSDLARVTGWNRDTAYTRVKRTPKSMKLGDLLNLADVLNVPAASLLEGVISR